MQTSAGGPGTILLYVNSPLVPLAMLHLGRHLTRGKHVVGCWAWELPKLPADWRHGVAFVHEIWMPSRFAAQAVASIAGGRPVRVVPYPVATRQPKLTPRGHGATRPFAVLSIFNIASSFARRHALAAIDAFRRAFADHLSTRLIVKTVQTFSVSALPHGLRSAKQD